MTDAAVLTASADGALVVVSAGQTLDTQLRDALTNLQAVQGHTLGVVLNRVSPKSSSAGYYSGSYGPAGAPERTAASASAGRGLERSGLLRAGAALGWPSSPAGAGRPCRPRSAPTTGTRGTGFASSWAERYLALFSIRYRQAWKCPHLGRRLMACGPRLGDMLAVYAASQSSDDPLSGLEIGERPDPEPAPGWTTVTLKRPG